MSWKDKLENIQFSIKTGDGKEYFPLLIITEKSLDFNTNIYDFINVPKSLVERKQPKSSKYPLKFYFQGADCIEQSEAFEQSAKDNRYWTVTHPFYGIIKGQPISISRNDSAYNTTEINVDFWESIVFDFPKSNLSVKDNTLVKRDSVDSNAALAYSSRVIPQARDIQENKQSNLVVAKSFENVQTAQTNVDYQNKLSKALKSSNSLLSNPNIAILDAQALLSVPSLYDIGLKQRINAYVTAFKSLIKVFKTQSDKLFFESQGASALSNLCLTSVNYQFGVDYLTVSDVESVVSSILENYSLYVNLLSENSTSNYTVENVYQPYPILQNDLYNLVMYTISNLYQLAFEAQQERIVYLEKDSNLILLTHKYLGKATDENIMLFKTINNISMNENFKLKKGRQIKYYV